MASSNYTLQQDYVALASAHQLYLKYRDRWQFLMQAYVGGKEYRDAGNLVRYALERDGEYQQRLNNTPYINHCQSVIQTYTSFLFREEPERDFGTWAGQQDVESFLKDCDYEDRSFDDFMKQVAIWSSVFGHVWLILTKPNIGAETLAQEQAAGVRPYINMMTPLVVSDFRWRRRETGRYELTELKYVEEVVDRIQVVRRWYTDRIETWEMDDASREANLMKVETNTLGFIPAVLVYNQRSIEKGIGVSDINDIADISKMIYNMTSENEQAVRLGTHPTLVVPPTAQVGAGAGAMIVLQEGSDPGLNPYALEFSGAAVGSIHDTVRQLENQIEKIANIGSVRATESRTVSGVALETEFQLLNARLSEKADNLELAEEQIWKIFGIYQGRTWEGRVEYPDSFNIRDRQREIQELVSAKSAATDPRVLYAIDHELLDVLGEDSDLIMPEYVSTEAANLPAKPLFEAHTMYHPETGDEVVARTEAEHIAYMEQGYIHEEESEYDE
jgi:hypothetical protein